MVGQTGDRGQTMSCVIFRADGGASIGSGHVMRCLTLASAFSERGWRVGFAASKETFGAVTALAVASIEKIELQLDSESEPTVLRGRWPDGIDLLVVDHYKRGASFESACRSWARSIAALDDLCDRHHDVDLLVDPGADSAEGYRRLVPSGCKILVGPSFAILDPEFRKARSRALRRRDGRAVDRVLVTFGQIDAPNATMQSIAVLQAAGFPGHVDIVLGHAAPHLATIRSVNYGRLHVDISPKEMASLMSEADLAIGAGGGTAWERCCVGLPTILVTLADNQRSVVAQIAGAGAGVHAGPVESGLFDRLIGAFRALIVGADRRMAMAKAGSQLVDGQCRNRVVQAAIERLADSAA